MAVQDTEQSSRWGGAKAGSEAGQGYLGKCHTPVALAQGRRHTMWHRWTWSTQMCPSSSQPSLGISCQVCGDLDPSFLHVGACLLSVLGPIISAGSTLFPGGPSPGCDPSLAHSCQDSRGTTTQ